MEGPHPADATDERLDRRVVVELSDQQARALSDCARVGLDGCPDENIAALGEEALQALDAAVEGPRIVIDGDPPTFRVVEPSGRDLGEFDTLPEALEAIEIWRSLR